MTGPANTGWAPTGLELKARVLDGYDIVETETELRLVWAHRMWYTRSASVGLTESRSAYDHYGSLARTFVKTEADARPVYAVHP